MNELPAREHDKRERGATAVEYGLLIAGVAALIVLVVFAFGGMVMNTLLKGTCDQVGQHTPGNTC